MLMLQVAMCVLTDEAVREQTCSRMGDRQKLEKASAQLGPYTAVGDTRWK